MKPNPANATLPPLLDRYRAHATGGKVGKLNELIRLTYQSTAIEGSSGKTLIDARLLYPIPQTEIDNNPDLEPSDQNLGY